MAPSDASLQATVAEGKERTEQPLPRLHGRCCLSFFFAIALPSSAGHEHLSRIVMQHMEFCASGGNLGQTCYNPILGLGGGGGGSHGSMDEVLANPYLYSSPFAQGPVSSHTCSDGSMSAGSLEGFQMDQFMGLVFDPKCAETIQHDLCTWFPHPSDNPDLLHQAAPDTSCSGNSPGSSDASDFGLSDFGSWERQKKADIGLEEMFAAPPLRRNNKQVKKKVKVKKKEEEEEEDGGDEELIQGGEGVFVEGSGLIPFAPTKAEGGLAADAGFPQYAPDERTPADGRFGANAAQYCSRDGLNKHIIQEDSCPRKLVVEEDGGGVLGQGTMSVQVQVQRDDTRRHGLDPILGASLGPTTRCESDYDEICLVHLLVAGAEAVATRDMDLASVILVRLKELVSCTGTTMQRVAAYFAQGLQSQIDLVIGGVGGVGVGGVGGVGGGVHMTHVRYHAESRAELLRAFQILHEVSPFIKFGHFTANEAILEAVREEQRVHIVDFEIMEGIQWPPLMQALASRKGGAPELKITALYRPRTAGGGLAAVRETGKRLAEFASSLGVPFTFSLLGVTNSKEGEGEGGGGGRRREGEGEEGGGGEGEEEEVNMAGIEVAKGEAVVANCMLDLPHMQHKAPRAAVSAFVRGVRRLNPVVFTLVEEELGPAPNSASASASAASSFFFFEALRHYSAVCESLESCLGPEAAAARALVERVFVEPRIGSAIASWSRSCCLRRRQPFSPRHTSLIARSLGFTPRPLSFHNVSQALLLLGLYKDGFKLDEIDDRLLLGWRGKPLFAASVWK